MTYVTQLHVYLKAHIERIRWGTYGRGEWGGALGDREGKGNRKALSPSVTKDTGLGSQGYDELPSLHLTLESSLTPNLIMILYHGKLFRSHLFPLE